MCYHARIWNAHEEIILHQQELLLLWVGVANGVLQSEICTGYYGQDGGAAASGI